MSIGIALLYDTQDREVRSQTDAEVCAIEALSVVSRLSPLTCSLPGCHGLKPTGFRATLKCSTSHLHGSCGKAQEAPVLLTHSPDRTTLLACLQELRNRIEQRHGSEFVKAVQACEFAHTTSRAE